MSFSLISDTEVNFLHGISPEDMDDLAQFNPTGINMPFYKPGDLQALIDRISEFKIKLLCIGYAVEKSFDVAQLSAFKDLESLFLDVKTKGKIDFSLFPKLRELSFKYRPPLDNVFELTQLERFFISSYPYEDLVPLQHMKKLYRLDIWGGKLQSTRGIDSFPNINEIELTMCRHLHDLQDVDKVPRGRWSPKRDRFIEDALKIEITACGKITPQTHLVEYTAKGIM